MSRIEKTTEADLKNRIRDNQRRSRQKRKEHLQELEEKLRQCQFQGVEASIEIQAEARKVAEENKKLRTLLNTHGILDDCIAEFLASGTIFPPRHPTSDYPHLAAASGTVQTLERLLEPRRPRCLEPSETCCAQSSVDSCSRQVEAAVTLKSRESSIVSGLSIWGIPAHPDGLRSSISSQEGQIQPPQYIAGPSSGTVLSRTGAAMALKGLSSIKTDARSPTSSNLASASVSSGAHSQQPYDYNMPLFSTSSGYDQPHPTRQRPSLPSSGTSSAASSNYMQTQQTENCSMATDVISGMTGMDPHHVRDQLGCMPGMDYHVGAASFGNVVDRYTTATTLGM
ncbi:hypothetical protein CONLIGDRAFT_246221 [Coniochaeta ligniaria NRRL 30616]|uniref:BZIP domain-containing protein n=1 Tax=Coniochaeta ligniaria NRRL 30616 TaxID=1408157 RepID=A0A1J7IXB1_9PEZI|nr:hypothetical protein CONLIGDRAFT_246221 [Coniochaeta ligniaria NRRL 30616]